MDRNEGFLEVGVNDQGEVVVNHPDLKPDENGVGHIVFSPDQARHLGRLLLSKAADADGFPGSGEAGEYFIQFNTEIQPGKIQAVRVRLDLVTIANMNKPMQIDLCDHPLAKELRQYLAANRR